MRELTLDIVEEAIRGINPDHRETWLHVGMALKAEFGDDAFQIWDDWSATGATYNKADARAAWKSFRKSGISIGTFIHLATDAGYKFPREELTDAELDRREKARAARQAELARQRAAEEKQEKARAREAALRAEKVWAQLSAHGQSAYLKTKQVDAYGLRFSPKGSAVAMVQDVKGKIHGLQFLRPDGSKRFWPKGIRKTGHYHRIGPEPAPDASGRVRFVICEGYATGASVHAATGLTVFVAFDAGNLLPAGKALRAKWRQADIIIAADDDHLTKQQTGENPGLDKAQATAKKIKARVIPPKFKNRTNEKWTDFNDLQIIEGLDAVAACFTRADEDWQHRLSRNQQGNVKAEINNVLLVLLHDERWAGVLRYDRFTYEILKITLPPFEHNARTGEWTETDTAWLQGWLSENYHFTPKESDTIRAVMAVAELRGFHPVLDYLHGLKWDSVARLDTWLADFLGASQNEYTQLVGRKFMIGAVARVHAELGRPVKMKNVMILEGLQDAGKSTVIEALATPWSSDTHFDLGSKDGYQQLRGIWIYEIGELDAFNKAESTRAKAFFSAYEDNYRPPYAKRSQKFPRQIVFVGTTNQYHYLKDVTGNVRYWPIRCYEINIESLRQVRDQLWAEALHLYREKVPHWVMPAERKFFEPEQEERFQEDAWESIILDWLNAETQRGLNEFTSADIMEGALEMKPHQIKPPEQTRVGLVMGRIGWEKKRTSPKNGRKWVYVRPEADRLPMNDADKPF